MTEMVIILPVTLGNISPMGDDTEPPWDLFEDSYSKKGPVLMPA